MSFFAKTDSGSPSTVSVRTFQLIDMELPIAALTHLLPVRITASHFIAMPESLQISLQHSSSACAQMASLIGVGSMYAAVSFPIVLASLYVIQRFYRAPRGSCVLPDLETKAPLYSLFEESLNGLATIRAFGWQKALGDKNHTLLDRSQRPFYLLFAVQRWLTLVLDLLVAAVAVLLIVLVVAPARLVGAGGVGLALLNVIQFSQSIKLLVTFWTTLETHIGSVARIKSFTRDNRVGGPARGERHPAVRLAIDRRDRVREPMRCVQVRL